MNKKELHKTINHYSSLYMKEQIIIVLVVTLPSSILFFVVSVFYKVLNYDFVISFIPIIFGMFYLFYAHLKTYFFKKMIIMQKKLLNISFDAENLIPLYPKTLFYSSGSWFIKSGCWAFHKSYVNKIKVRVVEDRHRHYIVKFYTIDGRVFTDRNMSSGEIRKFKKWHT